MSRQAQPRYDVFQPSALPSASLGRRPLVSASARADISGGEESRNELDKIYDSWNTRIDKEIKAVAGGLRELVELADIGTNPTPNTHTLTALHLKLKTSTLIRAAQTLRDTAHELRLALALGDDIGAVGRRDTEAIAARGEVDTLRREVAKEFGLMVSSDPRGEKDEEEEQRNKEAEDEERKPESPVKPPGHEASPSNPSPSKSPIKAASPVKEDAAPADGMEVDEEEDEFEEV